MDVTFAAANILEETPISLILQRLTAPPKLLAILVCSPEASPRVFRPHWLPSKVRSRPVLYFLPVELISLTPPEAQAPRAALDKLTTRLSELKPAHDAVVAQRAAAVASGVEASARETPYEQLTRERASFKQTVEQVSHPHCVAG